VSLASLAGLILALGLAAGAAAQTPAPAHCALRPAGGEWRGGCGRIFGAQPVLIMTPEPAILGGAWRADRTPSQAWAGAIHLPGAPLSPFEFETYADGTGILRTAIGWFPVSGFSANSLNATFDLDTAHQVAPSALDRRIIERAAVILQNPLVWNRADNRVCRNGARTWSLYCALHQASMELAGGFDHRRPALQLVRALVVERSRWRSYDHELMDYNNDPSTSLSDVQTLLADAAARIKAAP
jgi:hypothetical protein